MIECILNSVMQCYLNFFLKKQTSVLPWLDKKVLKFTLSMLGWDQNESVIFFQLNVSLAF